MPGLQVKAGPSLEQLKPASVNDEIGVPIESDYFHGKLILRVRQFVTLLLPLAPL